MVGHGKQSERQAQSGLVTEPLCSNLEQQRSATNLTFVITRGFIQAASEYNICLEDLEKAATESRARNGDLGVA